MRSMRLKQREVSDERGLRAIMDACATVRIAAVDEDGPFIVPMSFGYEWEDGAELPTIWLHGSGRGRKAAAFAMEGAIVAFEMDIADGLIEGGTRATTAWRIAASWAPGASRRSRREKTRSTDSTSSWSARPRRAVRLWAGIIDRTSVWRLEVEQMTGKRHER